MPPVASPYCRMQGCHELRHVYPSGSKSQYCAAHMKYRKAKQRAGHDSMTGQMRDILCYLLQRKQEGDIWCILTYPFAHGATLKNLMNRDWIFTSEVNGISAHKITGRGEDALAYFDATEQPRDGLCPRCRTQPRHVRSSGQSDGYCLDCLRIRGKEKRERGAHNGDVSRPCSRCHKRPRYQYPGGTYSTYCQHCARVTRRMNKRKQDRHLLKAVKSGFPVPPCKYCKQRPRRVFANSISSYCDICRPVLMRKFKLKRRVAKHGIYF